jgi:hypothetical protein
VQQTNLTPIKKWESVTEQQRADFWEEHLPYEINMLRASIKAVTSSRPFVSDDGKIRWAIKNATAFCIHARNLIEFFGLKKRCDFDPRWFTLDSYRVEEKNFVGETLVTKLSTQIVHLTKKRARGKRPEKLTPPTDHLEIYRGLEAAIQRFEGQLRREYQLHCHTPPASDLLIQA